MTIHRESLRDSLSIVDSSQTTQSVATVISELLLDECFMMEPFTDSQNIPQQEILTDILSLSDSNAEVVHRANAHRRTTLPTMFYTDPQKDIPTSTYLRWSALEANDVLDMLRARLCYRGDWDETINYGVSDVVAFEGLMYCAQSPNLDRAPRFYLSLWLPWAAESATNLMLRAPDGGRWLLWISLTGDISTVKLGG